MSGSLIITAVMIIGSPMINNSGYIATTTFDDSGLEGLVEVSYYGANEYGEIDPIFKNQKMANSQTFDAMNPTIVANKELDFGTRVKFTNPDNGRQIICIVQDKGPYVEGRIYDLSYAAMKHVGGPKGLKDGTPKLVAEIIR